MSCPDGVNTGFIQLNGPISQTDLNGITHPNPINIAFGPRSTIPNIFGNRIDETTYNTCTYFGNTYTLEYVKICSVMNTGYIIPGITEVPEAELIISFKISSNKNLTKTTNILLCVPIYNSTYLSHDKYITQILDNSSCKPSSLDENTTYYKENTTYTIKKANSLSKCYSQACNNPTTLAYTYYPNTNSVGLQKGNCLLFNSIPISTKTALSKEDEKYSISGTVNHNQSYNTNKGTFFTLESIFHSDKDDTVQTSLAYTTCFGFEEYNSITSYVLVFPNGIHLTSSIFQYLKIKLDGKFIPYSVSGTEFKRINSISTISDNFRKGFQYFQLPPNTQTKKFNTDTCPYYQTSQYKCTPFNQLTDLSNNYVIPGNKTLEDILEKEEEEEPINTDDVMIYAIVGVLSIVFITGLYFALKD